MPGSVSLLVLLGRLSVNKVDVVFVGLSLRCSRFGRFAPCTFESCCALWFETVLDLGCDLHRLRSGSRRWVYPVCRSTVRGSVALLPARSSRAAHSGSRLFWIHTKFTGTKYHTYSSRTDSNASESESSNASASESPNANASKPSNTSDSESQTSNQVFLSLRRFLRHGNDRGAVIVLFEGRNCCLNVCALIG